MKQLNVTLQFIISDPELYNNDELSVEELIDHMIDSCWDDIYACGLTPNKFSIKEEDNLDART